MNTPTNASNLNQSATDTADTSKIPTEALEQMEREGWPSLEIQKKYWETHDHGGNFLPSRIEANEERYGE